MLNHSLVPVGSTGYSIDNSVRLNDNDSAGLSRTPGTVGNFKTWTWSGWFKRGNLGNQQCLFQGGYPSGSVTLTYFGLLADNSLEFYDTIYGVGEYTNVSTTQLFRDTSAWYHLTVAYDTTQATASNRIKIYVNGEQVTAFDTTSYPSQNYQGGVNRTWSHNLGKSSGFGGDPFDGYLAEVNFVDGQALTPSDFGETDEDYGHWKPKAYEGTYGTNGFYLDFKNSGSLGNDVSGAGNNWTPNNLAATDQMLDSPTNNFCTWNAVDNYSLPLSEGNLKTTSLASYNVVLGTQSFSTGKYYWEIAIVSNTVSLNGLASTAIPHSARNSNLGGTYAAGYYADGRFFHNGVYSSGSATYTTGDIISIAANMNTKDVTWYKNNTLVKTIRFDGSDGINWEDMIPAWTIGSAVAGHYDIANFGQDSSFAGNKTAQGNSDDNGIGDFYYTPPTGYLALCTQNLPEPTVVPSEHFNTVLYTGNGGTQSITGVGFQPDFVWVKPRSATLYHFLTDTIRGVTNTLSSNTTDNEAFATEDVLSSFDSDGFSLTADDGAGYYGWNRNGDTLVAWNWKANGTGVSNTDGSITSTVSANVDAGFSIVNFVGSGSNGTVGHGLSKKPEYIINKPRDRADNWNVYQEFLGPTDPETDYSILNSTSGYLDNNTIWNDTAPTSSVFNVGSNGGVNASGENFINYCFHSVAGFSKCGSFYGNGSSDGPFIALGFTPAFIMVKRDSAAAWFIYDIERGNYPLYAHSTQTDSASYPVDFVSNGLKVRTTDGNLNANGGRFNFIAFAEHPFKHSNAR